MSLWDSFIGRDKFKAKPYKLDMGAYDSAAPDGWRADLDARRDAVEKRQLFDPTQVNQDREKQNQFLDYLSGRARGDVSSAADRTFDSSLSKGNRLLMSQAASMARGVNPGLAQRNLLNTSSDMSLQGSQDASVIAAQEQARAQEALVNGQSNMRAQDYQTQQMRMQEAQQNDSMVQHYMLQGATYDEAQRQAKMAAQLLKAQGYANAQQINAGISQNNAGAFSNVLQKMTGGLINSAATGGAYGLAGAGGGGGAATAAQTIAL